MGLFDHKQNNAAVITYSPRNEQEALIAILHACIAVDEDIADRELEELANTLTSLEIFREHDVREYYRTVLLAHARIGSKQLIDNSVDFVSVENKDSLFALTIEMLLADGVLAAKEEELISYITSALDLDEKTADSIVQNKLSQHKQILKKQ